MATIERFEDLEIWKKSRELSKFISVLCQKERFNNDTKLIMQIRSSSGSIMDNIAEGFERGGNREFSQFIWIAKGSTGELKSQLYRALDNGYVGQVEFEASFQLAEEISKMASKLLGYLKNCEIKGQKYR